ncbi:MAG: HEAT repeat domain-containing protein [Methanoregula sp.]|jgi:HEAT repeat protein|nr:HEAT repeat domain-containing protein [Methanoregula sp.]
MVEIMGISLEQQDGEWYKSLPRSGGVYDLIYTAASGTGLAERLRAVVALGKSGDPRAVRPLVDLLGETDPEIRLAATTALGNLKSGRPVDELIELLQDRNEQMVTREQAAIALTSIRSTGALRGLREFSQNEDEDPVLRQFAGNLLKDISAF